MRVRMKVGVSGTRNGQPWPARGETLDLPDDEGAQMCASGMAEPVAEHDKAEKAVPAETAEKRAEPEKTDDKGGDKGDSQPAKRGPGRPRKTQG